MHSRHGVTRRCTVDLMLTMMLLLVLHGTKYL